MDVNVLHAPTTHPPATPQPLADDWRNDALCLQVDPAIFHVEKDSSVAPAKQVCETCPARTSCLEDAMARNEQWGIWGGRTPTERRRLRKARARATERNS